MRNVNIRELEHERGKPAERLRRSEQSATSLCSALETVTMAPAENSTITTLALVAQVRKEAEAHRVDVLTWLAHDRSKDQK